MEFIGGKIKIKYIFLHNNNWFRFFKRHAHLIRPAIMENVTKVLACRSPLLGFHSYFCLGCNSTKKVPHSCKSRFCSSCGKTATDAWINNALATLPNVRYQHITFTMPSEYWDLFRVNRHLIGKIPKIAARIVIDICGKGKRRKHYLPGIFLAIHSYGRDLKFNIHIHLSTTVGGFSLKNPDKYIQGSTIDHQTIKNMWKYQITKLLRDSFKAGSLRPYPDAKSHFTNLTTFNKWLDSHYQKTWNVHLQKTQEGAKQTAEYLGRYIKRPPLAEARILSYDGNAVSFSYLDHATDTYKVKTLPVSDFIAALISHIPDKYFRMIRYFGFLANRVRTRYLSLINPAHQKGSLKKESYATRFFKAFHRNPLQCPCGNRFALSFITFAQPLPDLMKRHHGKIASLSAA